MKRFFTMIVAVCAFLTVSAQHPMVTLSHNGELSFFTNQTAFETALKSAENGDILYLSEGNFIINGNNYTIRKRLNIVGSGYQSHIIGNIIIDMSSNSNSWMDAPLFDGVRLDNLDFNAGDFSYKNLGKSEIRRSWIQNITNGEKAGTEITYDKCYINNITFTSENDVLLKNSKINNILGNGCSGIVVENCNIKYVHYYPRYMISSILNKEKATAIKGSPVIYNSLLRRDPSSDNTDKDKVTQHDCYILEQLLLNDDLEATVNLIENGYLGLDGVTEVGIHGGENPFSENPSVPTVDSKKSSVVYDAAGNKLKVSITVKAD